MVFLCIPDDLEFQIALRSWLAKGSYTLNWEKTIQDGARFYSDWVAMVESMSSCEDLVVQVTRIADSLQSLDAKTPVLITLAEAIADLRDNPKWSEVIVWIDLLESVLDLLPTIEIKASPADWVKVILDVYFKRRVGNALDKMATALSMANMIGTGESVATGIEAAGGVIDASLELFDTIFGAISGVGSIAGAIASWLEWLSAPGSDQDEALHANLLVLNEIFIAQGATNIQVNNTINVDCETCGGKGCGECGVGVIEPPPTISVPPGAAVPEGFADCEDHEQYLNSYYTWILNTMINYGLAYANGWNEFYDELIEFKAGANDVLTKVWSKSSGWLATLLNQFAYLNVTPGERNSWVQNNTDAVMSYFADYVGEVPEISTPAEVSNTYFEWIGLAAQQLAIDYEQLILNAPTSGTSEDIWDWIKTTLNQAMDTTLGLATAPYDEGAVRLLFEALLGSQFGALALVKSNFIDNIPFDYRVTPFCPNCELIDSNPSGAGFTGNGTYIADNEWTAIQNQGTPEEYHLELTKSGNFDNCAWRLTYTGTGDPDEFEGNSIVRYVPEEFGQVDFTYSDGEMVIYGVRSIALWTLGPATWLINVDLEV